MLRVEEIVLRRGVPFSARRQQSVRDDDESLNRSNSRDRSSSRRRVEGGDRSRDHEI